MKINTIFKHVIPILSIALFPPESIAFQPSIPGRTLCARMVDGIYTGSGSAMLNDGTHMQDIMASVRFSTTGAINGSNLSVTLVPSMNPNPLNLTPPALYWEPVDDNCIGKIYSIDTLTQIGSWTGPDTYKSITMTLNFNGIATMLNLTCTSRPPRSGC